MYFCGDQNKVLRLDGGQWTGLDPTIVTNRQFPDIWVYKYENESGFGTEFVGPSVDFSAGTYHPVKGGASEPLEYQWSLSVVPEYQPPCTIHDRDGNRVCNPENALIYEEEYLSWNMDADIRVSGVELYVDLGPDGFFGNHMGWLDRCGCFRFHEEYKDYGLERSLCPIPKVSPAS